MREAGDTPPPAPPPYRSISEEDSGFTGRNLLPFRLRKEISSVSPPTPSLGARRTAKPGRAAEPGGRFITAQVPHVCDGVFNDDAIFVVDGGNTAVWTTFFHEVKSPNTVLTTPKFGMLGAGVPQALGAAAALPGRQICCIIGDGAMGFNIQEIETAVRNNMPIVFIVCCDKQWGMVKMTQSFASRPWKTLLFKSLRPEETVNTDFGPITFDEVARAMGAHGERVTKATELEPALRRALASGRCAVVQAEVDPVRHMWAPNLLTFKKLHLEPKGR